MPIFSAVPRPSQVVSTLRQMIVPATRPVTRDWVPGNIDRVVVIGAGLAGLTAACRLQAAGASVTVVEAEAEVGGRCRTEWLSSAHGDFAADTGATVLTMPGLVDSSLQALGISPADVGWSYRKLAPAYHATFASGRHLDVFGDADRMTAEVRRFAADKYGASSDRAVGVVAGYQQHRSWIADVFGASFENFMAADYDSVLDTMSTPAAANDLGHLVSLGAFGSLGRKAQRNLTDEEIARVFSFQALYAGVAPARARAVYGMISHMDTSMGVFYPEFGMGDVPTVLAKAFELAGGRVLTGSRAKKIIVDGARATGVELENGNTLPADAVVATPDLPVVEELVDSASLLSGRHPVWSPSAMVIHGSVPVALAETWAGDAVATGHHTISFGESWEQTFKEITAKNGKGQLMSDPSLLITRPAASAPDRVFTGHDGRKYEPLSILAPTPNLNSAAIDWQAIAPHYAEELLRELTRRGFTGITEGLAIGRIDTPQDWADQGHGAGSPFALAHTVLQTGPFRPKNYPVGGVNNIVLAGSSTTPGVGVPTTMISGSLAARRITGGGAVK